MPKRKPGRALSLRSETARSRVRRSLPAEFRDQSIVVRVRDCGEVLDRLLDLAPVEPCSRPLRNGNHAISHQCECCVEQAPRVELEKALKESALSLWLSGNGHHRRRDTKP